MTKYTQEQKAAIVEDMLSKAMYELENAILEKFDDVDFDATIDGAVYNKAFNAIAKMYTLAIK